MIRALEDALGPQGTLVMPAHTTDLSEPSFWANPPVPAAWWQTIRDELPPFTPDLTPTRGMGRIAECFRKQEGTLRSHHPHYSFAARGARARELTADHALAMGLGEESPLRRIYDDAGWVLLLGVGHDSNTSLHLAEHRTRHRPRSQAQGAPLWRDGERHWVTFAVLDLDVEDFVALGADFARDSGVERQGLVGRARSRLMPQRPLVDYASGWFDAHRGAG